jgi:GNAT superfamily N-acetyltransferase
MVSAAARPEMISLNFRLANPNDIDTLVKVRFDYFAAENWVIDDNKRELISSRLYKYYPSHLNNDFFSAFAETDSGDLAAVSFLVITEKPANLSFPTGKTGVILNVLTYPEYRRKGYAAQTLNMLIDIARKNELSFLELSASEMGRPLYKKLGFKEAEKAHHTEMKLSLLD